MSKDVLVVKDLNMHYETLSGNVSAVKNVSFSVKEGESFGLVGESGCGKTSVAMSLLQLQAENAKISSGSITLDGTEMVGMSESELRKVRWDGISIVFQGAMNAWNPVVKVGEQIREAIREHYPNNTKIQNTEKIESLFKMVGLDSSIMDRFPHELSGGMKQRAVIALALSCDPKVVIADEPTTALDVTIQAQILDVINESSKKLGTAVVLITHNLGVVARYADRVNVMYAGQIIERGTAEAIFSNPLHAYTKGLMSSVPRLDETEKVRLNTIEGQPPLLLREIDGCAFAARNPNREHCLTDRHPALVEKEKDHWVVDCPGCLM